MIILEYFLSLYSSLPPAPHDFRRALQAPLGQYSALIMAMYCLIAILFAINFFILHFDFSFEFDENYYLTYNLKSSMDTAAHQLNIRSQEAPPQFRCQLILVACRLYHIGQSPQKA